MLSSASCHPVRPFTQQCGQYCAVRMTTQCQCRARPHNIFYALHFARTGLVTAPCSTISHLRPDDFTLSTSPCLYLMHVHGMQRSPDCTSVEAIGGTLINLRSSLWHKKLARIFSSYYQASRECIRSGQFFSKQPSKEVRSCCYKQRD